MTGRTAPSGQQIATQTRPFVHHPAVFEQWVRGRRAIYLDNNIWIDLADGKSPEATDCRRVCQQAVREGRIIFSISAAAVEELLDQPNEARPMRQAELMDELSKGVCLRSAPRVWDHEARAVLDVFPGSAAVLPDRRMVFTHVFEYVADGELVFAEEWDQGSINRFMALLREDLPTKGVAWLVEHLPRQRMREGHVDANARYVVDFAERIAACSEHFRRPGSGVNRADLLFEEQLWAFREIVLPALRDEAIGRWGIEGAAQFFQRGTDRHDEGGKARIRKVMLSTPSLALFCELMAGRVGNPTRKVKPQDRLDIDHACVAAAYCDVFVTRDGNLRDLLQKSCKVPALRRCHVARSVAELATAIADSSAL